MMVGCRNAFKKYKVQVRRPEPTMERKGSDIDLLVIKESNKDYWKRAEEIAGILGDVRLDVPKDVLNITPKELKYRLSINDFFIKDIINNGKAIYERVR